MNNVLIIVSSKCSPDFLLPTWILYFQPSLTASLVTLSEILIPASMNPQRLQMRSSYLHTLGHTRMFLGPSYEKHME